MNYNYYIVFDFETDSTNKETCNVVELAAMPVNPKTLEIEKNKSFKCTICPDGIHNDDYFTPERNETIRWHAKQRKTTEQNIIDLWKNGISTELAIKNFAQYCNDFTKNISKGGFSNYRTEPIPVGYNIINFDIPILRRLCEKYKVKYPFSEVYKIDMMDNLFMWLESLPEPKRLGLDTVRPFLGMSSDQAHEALSDVIDEANLMVRFLQFHRKQASIEKFKDSFNVNRD